MHINFDFAKLLDEESKVDIPVDMVEAIPSCITVGVKQIPLKELLNFARTELVIRWDTQRQFWIVVHYPVISHQDCHPVANPLAAVYDQYARRGAELASL